MLQMNLCSIVVYLNSNSNKFQFGFLLYFSFFLLEFFHNVVPLSINKKLSRIHYSFIGPNGWNKEASHQKDWLGQQVGDL